MILDRIKREIRPLLPQINGFAQKPKGAFFPIIDNGERGGLNFSLKLSKIAGDKLICMFIQVDVYDAQCLVIVKKSSPKKPVGRVGHLSADCQPTVLGKSVGHLSADCQPTVLGKSVGHLSADCQPTVLDKSVGHLSAICRPTVDQLS